jgi:hypothetical protein
MKNHKALKTDEGMAGKVFLLKKLSQKQHDRDSLSCGTHLWIGCPSVALTAAVGTVACALHVDTRDVQV